MVSEYEKGSGIRIRSSSGLRFRSSESKGEAEGVVGEPDDADSKPDVVDDRPEVRIDEQFLHLLQLRGDFSAVDVDGRRKEGGAKEEDERGSESKGTKGEGKNNADGDGFNYDDNDDNDDGVDCDEDDDDWIIEISESPPRVNPASRYNPESHSPPTSSLKLPFPQSHLPLLRHSSILQAHSSAQMHMPQAPSPLTIRGNYPALMASPLKLPPSFQAQSPFSTGEASLSLDSVRPKREVDAQFQDDKSVLYGAAALDLTRTPGDRSGNGVLTGSDVEVERFKQLFLFASAPLPPSTAKLNLQSKHSSFAASHVVDNRSVGVSSASAISRGGSTEMPTPLFDKSSSYPSSEDSKSFYSRSFVSFSNKLSSSFEQKNVAFSSAASDENNKLAVVSTKTKTKGAVVKPYLCRTCGNGFKSYSNLLIHSRIHTG